MWGHARTLWAVLIVALFSLSSFSVVIGSLPESEPNASEEPIAYGECYGGSSERTTIIETFTATWCQYCPPQAFANNRLYDELGHERFVVLEHHASSSGLIYLAESRTRMLQYGATGYPTAVMDGGGYYYNDAPANGQAGATLWSSGGTAKWQRYFDNRNMFEYERNRNSNLTISLTGNLTSSEGKVFAHIEATDDITETNLKVKFMVYESNIYVQRHGGGENYLHHRVYDHVVRAVLADYTVPATFDQAGETLDIERTFTINGAWDIRNLGVAVMVQTDNSIGFMYMPSMAPRNNYPILQAAAMYYIPIGLMLVDGDDTDNLANDFDHYDEIMTKVQIPHDNWDTHETKMVDTESDNVRTMPAYGNISSYPGMIWFTGGDTSTLSLASRNTITSFLDGYGSLVIIGEEIGNDANMNGWTTWLDNNLHATFIQDNSGDTLVDGIATDPISDGFNDLAVNGGSPDVIATSGSTQIFVFSASGTDVAGVRMDHDPDSRVIYNSFNYFEGTDSEDMIMDDELLMNRLIDWIDGASAPFVDVLQPDGGEIWSKSTQYDIFWYSNDVEMPEQPISIDYTTDSASPTWIPITSGEPNDGHYLWTTPNLDSTKCRVRVCAVDSVGNSNCVISDADFTIGVPPADTTPPDIYNALLNGKVSEIVNPGDMVDFTATVDDADSNVEGANYSVDAVPAGPMDPQDGMFDEGIETAFAMIDTTGWSEAIYMICVSEAWDVFLNFNITGTACASLEVTLAPVDNDPPEIYALVDGQPSVLVPSGALVTLDARLLDETQVSGANYTIGIANWPGTVLSATDGAFDEDDENVTTGIDTTGWPEASYDICVYAWDSISNLNLTGSCPQIVVSSDFYPPEILDVFIDGAPTQSWDYDVIPPDFFLTATIDDTATGNNNIGEANYTVGPSNWPGIKMFPVDMVYNDPIEDVQQIVTTPTQPGTYDYCVYAYDDKTNTNWTGLCATLFILDPNPPIVTNVLVNGSVSTVVPIGNPVTVDATVDDTGTGNSNILSANYTDGVANWASSTPLLAVDGTFDGPVEDVTILIDTTSWTLGLHDICVYGEDEYGNADTAAIQCAQMDIIAFGPIPPIMMDAQLTGVGMADILVTWQASGDDGAGLDNVVEYEVYTSNIYNGVYSLVTTIPAVDQATYQYTCTGCGYGDANNHFFYVRAFNGLEYSTSPNRAGKFTRHLTVGQQLISVPLVTSDTSIGSVLQTIQFDKAWTYDASDALDPWKWHETAKPWKGDLWDINHMQAYWINVVAEDDWVVAGLVPVLTQIQLYAGWNFVSFPSFNPIYTVGQLKLDIAALEVEGFDPGVPYCLTSMGDLDMITAGEGFWIYVASARVWDIIQ
jgi:hypothetical protein